jgi:hypothetical protein
MLVASLPQGIPEICLSGVKRKRGREKTGTP